MRPASDQSAMPTSTPRIKLRPEPNRSPNTVIEVLPVLAELTTLTAVMFWTEYSRDFVMLPARPCTVMTAPESMTVYGPKESLAILPAAEESDVHSVASHARPPNLSCTDVSASAKSEPNTVRVSQLVQPVICPMELITATSYVIAAKADCNDDPTETTTSCCGL